MGDKKPAGLGFESELEDLGQWAGTPESSRKAVDTHLVRSTAAKEGFVSREAKPERATKPGKGRPPKKERTDQINFRAKVKVLEAFRAIGAQQEPEWPLGYTLERAVAALTKELEA
jgi:hypothetical protein